MPPQARRPLSPYVPVITVILVWAYLPWAAVDCEMMAQVQLLLLWSLRAARTTEPEQEVVWRRAAASMLELLKSVLESLKSENYL
ncbi:hypothetical protein NDU88_007341 [Pleurodeles waltl]|uniref:Secreted protein n=1 Tax=Pleurodeles waltl TaxID=8319 RepID=A0AAV7QPJ5_PLEWA|nr:hypothetical protein NDU88_007341 [Pleurodeles waltl]